MNYLATNIRLLRKKSSKIQEDIGLLVKKGQTTIGNWENGKSEPSIDELLTISNYFDISTDILLKVDLTKVNLPPAIQKKEKKSPPSDKNTTGYNQDEWKSMVKENDENTLTDILKEIRALRQEFNLARNEPNTSGKRPNSSPKQRKKSRKAPDKARKEPDPSDKSNTRKKSGGPIPD